MNVPRLENGAAERVNGAWRMELPGFQGAGPLVGFEVCGSVDLHRLRSPCYGDVWQGLGVMKSDGVPSSSWGSLPGAKFQQCGLIFQFWEP